jgi:hypothetical protein
MLQKTGEPLTIVCQQEIERILFLIKFRIDAIRSLLEKLGMERSREETFSNKKITGHDRNMTCDFKRSGLYP